MMSNEYDKEMNELKSKVTINVEHAVKFYELIGKKKELEKEGIEQYIDNNITNKANKNQQKKIQNKKRKVK